MVWKISVALQNISTLVIKRLKIVRAIMQPVFEKGRLKASAERLRSLRSEASRENTAIVANAPASNSMPEAIA